MEKSKLPKIQDLYSNVQEAQKNDAFTALMNQQPKHEWIREHPFVKNHRYIPIGIVEYLLKKVFKKYRIEILREGQSFNGVYVVVRVWYLHPISGEMEYHDGIGACQLQTKSGASAADLVNINNGALSMAFPIAKTLAVKDACDHFGTLFGSDINRKDYIQVTADEKLQSIDIEKIREQNG